MRWPYFKSWLVPLTGAMIVVIVMVAGFGAALKRLIFLAIAMVVVVLIVLTIDSSFNPLSRRELADSLRKVLDGTMDAYEWDYLTSISLRHDPLLESVQAEFSGLMEEQYLVGAADQYFFNEKGLQEIRRLVAMLEQAEPWRGEDAPPHGA